MRNDRLSRRSLIQVAAGTAALGSIAHASAKDDESRQAKKQATPLLDELDKTPAAAQLALVMKWLNAQPLALFSELRDARPVMRLGNIVLVARYADVLEVLGHPSVFSVRLYKPKMGDFMLTHDETPTHRRDKSVMSAMLPMSDTAMIREKIGGFASKAILKASGRIEVVNEFARLVPLQLVQDYFGLDGVDIGELKRWSYWAQFDNFHNHHFHERENAMEISQRAGEAKQQLAAYATALVQRRTGELRRDPNRDDIVSRMLKSKFPPSVGFGLDRVVANAMGLLIGAVETTSHAIVHAIDELLSRPKELAAAVQSAAEGDFETLSEYVWEANRFRPISPFMFRYCEQDFTIAKGTERETEIPTGVTVFTLTQSAMFDPVEFDNPTEFRADRPKYQSFLFGFGHHRCLGEYVGREMIPEAIKALVVCKNLRRADGPAGHIDFKDGPFPESLTLTYDQ